MIEVRPIPPTGILQEWVAKLPLRHQGCLLGCIRGCDNVPKEDPAKDLTRALRGVILYTHCLNPEDAGSFIDHCTPEECWARIIKFRKNFDHYPVHFVTHTMHAIQVIGYKHPDPKMAGAFRGGYIEMCRALHVRPEMGGEMERRLTADESTFQRDN